MRGRFQRLVGAATVRVVSALAALGLAGCASTTGPTPYPADWPPLVAATAADGCPPIEGTYANQASATHPAGLGDGPGLHEVFARMGRGTGLTSPAASGRSWAEAASADTVSFVPGPGSLQVVFDAASAHPVRLDFRRYRASLSEKRFDDLYTCHAATGAARLRFMAEPESHAGVFANLYVEAGGTLVFLLKAADGSLVVQWRSESFAISSVLVGSHVRFDSVWWRYPAAAPALTPPAPTPGSP